MRQLQRLFKGRGRQQLKPLAQIIAGLFKGGTPGAWYDPSDRTTLFQNSAGTTPVTAVEQPVGLMLDKSGRGNHAFQATAASRPVLSARYNLLTKTEQFDDAAWAKNAVTVTSNATVAPDGTTTADLIYPSSSGTLRAVYNNAAIVSSAGISYVSKFYVKRSGFRWVAIDGFNTSYAAYFDLLNGVVGTVLSGHTATITTAGDDWYLCSVTTTTSNGSAGYTAARPVDANGSQTATTSGINGLYIWGADLRVANNGTTQPAYQRVNTATDYATTGFLPYLKFDGVDDSLSTNSINFTSTDKMSVFAGMRKLSDAADGVLVDNFVVGQNGNFQVLAPYAGVSKYSLYSKGTLQAGAETNSSAYAAPITNVLTGISDISGDRVTLRLNSAQVASNTTDQGTGNYGNYPLYIGRRNNASLPFNGQLYSMIIVGKAVTAGELSSSEKYVNTKTGAY